MKVFKKMNTFLSISSFVDFSSLQYLCFSRLDVNPPRLVAVHFPLNNRLQELPQVAHHCWIVTPMLCGGAPGADGIQSRLDSCYSGSGRNKLVTRHRVFTRCNASDGSVRFLRLT